MNSLDDAHYTSSKWLNKETTNQLLLHQDQPSEQYTSVKYQLTFVSKKNGRPTRKVIDDKNNDQPQQQIQAGGHSTLTFKVDQN